MGCFPYTTRLRKITQEKKKTALKKRLSAVFVSGWVVWHRGMDGNRVNAATVTSFGGKTRQWVEIENVNIQLMAEGSWRYNTRSIKDNLRPSTLETRALNHEVIHSDWSRSVVITWECYIWLQSISVKRFKTGFNGSEVMCLEILSEGANRILRAFYWHLAAVRWN